MLTKTIVIGDTKVVTGIDRGGLYITLTQDEDVIILSPQQVFEIADIVRGL